MKKRIIFEEGMQELETLVQALESGRMSLEESFKAYERAVKLQNELQKLLDESDRRIRVLTETGERVLAQEEEACPER